MVIEHFPTNLTLLASSDSLVFLDIKTRLKINPGDIKDLNFKRWDLDSVFSRCSGSCQFHFGFKTLCNLIFKHGQLKKRTEMFINLHIVLYSICLLMHCPEASVGGFYGPNDILGGSIIKMKDQMKPLEFGTPWTNNCHIDPKNTCVKCQLFLKTNEIYRFFSLCN